jgi:2-oxoisovalerate dehydrogenase E2 component (dihydrolipoyl transacylase)
LPRYDHENNLVPTHIMQASWSADHRVIDGATMARFSNLVKKYIENLSFLIIDLK